MPLYDYACKDCSYTFSEFHSIADRNIPTETACVECKDGEIVKVIGAPMTSYSTTTRRTDDDFNSKLKMLRDRVPEQYKANLEKNIR